ncbi:MAG: DUF3987 domain-containing protein [Bacteroides sp.]|nr:DUF3987 domain-containing protein [Bacteroides sp.]
MLDYVKSVRSWARQCTPALFAQTIDSPQVADVCAQIEDAREQLLRGELTADEYKTLKDQLKKQLPGFTFQAHYQGNGRRMDKNAQASGLCIYDKDHVANPSEWFNSHVAPRIGELGIVLAHITPSMEGVRLVFKVAPGISLANAQFSLANALVDGDYDGCVKDMARVSFAVPRSYLLHLDEAALFAPIDPDYKMPFPISQPTNSLPHQPANSLPHHHTNSPTHQHTNTLPHHHTTTLKWPCKRPTKRVMMIIAKAMEKRGISQAALEHKGQRHYMFVNLLSTGICRLLTKEELMGGLKKLAPKYTKEPDCWQLVADFYANYTDPNKPVSNDFAWTFREVMNLNDDGTPIAPNAQHTPAREEHTADSWQKGRTDELLQRLEAIRLPIGLDDSLAALPRTMKLPVLTGLMPVASAYACHAQAIYADGRLQPMALMAIVVGEQASGKSACKNVVEKWLMPMAEADAEERRKEEAWKKRNKQRSANEKGEAPPESHIRYVPVTVSNSTLLKRMKLSKGDTLYSFGEELDTLLKTNGAGSWSAKYDVYRMAFDWGEWGQDYNSDNAESGIVNVKYNWTILGTYGALQRCFKTGNLENGLSSRIMLGEMPDNRFQPMTRFEQMTAEQQENIRKAVQLLADAKGTVQADDVAAEMDGWVEEKRLEALETMDLVKDTYRKRAAVIGFRCGVICRILEQADGQEQPSQATAFARLMADYTLLEQCKLFGEGWQAIDQSIKAYNPKQRNILDVLPTEFTIDDVRRAKGEGFSESALSMIPIRWTAMGWTEKLRKGVWRKCR